MSLWFAITDLYCARSQHLYVFDEALDFLERTHRAGITLSCATGRTATREQFSTILRDLNIDTFFKETISYGETDHVKVIQAGDVDKSFMFKTICDKIGVDIKDSWYITDIPVDADKALANNFARVFGVKTGGTNPELFSEGITVLDTLAQL